MPHSLVDIGQGLAETVTVRGKKIEARGLTAEEFFGLVVRFPAFRQFVDKDPEEAKKIQPGQMLSEIPQVCAAMMAICIAEKPGDEKEEKAARKLPMSTQLKLLGAIVECTFDEGVGPFVLAMNNLIQRLSRNQDQASAASDTPSTAPSPASLSMDIIHPPFGRTRRVKSRRSTKPTTATVAPH